MFASDKIGRWVAYLLGLAILFKSSFALILNPTSFMDEGYYLGATHAILNGDFFLHHCNFDKPFLVPFWPIPGILLFGENSIGFHFIPLLCFLVSFVLLFRILEKISPCVIRNFLFSIVFFSFPILHIYGVSNFCEPYLIFTSFFLIHSIVYKKSDRLISNLFFVGLFTKYSFLLWLPLIVLNVWLKNDRPKFKLKNWLKWTGHFCLQSKLLIVLWFIFSALNGAPFSSVTWLSGLQSANEGISIFTRTWNWAALLFDHFSHPAIGGAFLLTSLAGLFFAYQKRKRSNYFYLFWVPMLLHFLFFPLSNAPLMGRYLIQFLPLFFICIFLAIEKSKWISSAILLIIFVYTYGLPLQSLGGDPSLGRTLYALRQEINRPNVILHDSFQWASEVFRDKVYDSGCIADDCIQEKHAGVKAQKFQYVLRDKSLFKVYPTFQKNSLKLKALSDYDLKSVAEDTLRRVKLFKTFQIESIEKIKAAPISDDRKIYGSLRPFFDGASILIHARAVKNVFPILSKNDEMSIQVSLGTNDLHEYTLSFNQPRNFLIARVDQMKLRGVEYTDFVMPLFFGGYVIPLRFIPEVWSESTWVFSPQFSDLDKLSYSVAQSEDLH